MDERIDKVGLGAQNIGDGKPRSVEPRPLQIGWPGSFKSAGQLAAAHEVWGVAGGEVDVDSAGWLKFLGEKALTKGAPRNGWDRTITQWGY